MGPVVLSLAAGVAVLLFGALVNGCRINQLLGGATSNDPAQGPLVVTPAEVEDSALAGTTAPRRSTIQVTNDGTWSATNDSPWIGVSPRSGSGRRTLTLALNPVGLLPGPHEGSVTVAAVRSDEPPVTVAVRFVIQQPILDIDPRSVSRSTRSANAQLEGDLEVKNEGTGPLVWTASNRSKWLTLENVAGVGEGEIEYRISSAGLAVGTYRDTIVVVAVGAEGSPARIPVTFTRRTSGGDDSDTND